MSEQILPLGDIHELPRPWEPESCPPKLRGEIWAWLDQVVDWLNTDYCWDPDGLIPACWPHHPHLVHELAVLADQRRLAGQAFTSDLLEEWHRYTLPSFHDRLRSRLRSHCDEATNPGRRKAARPATATEPTTGPGGSPTTSCRAAAKVCRGRRRSWR